MACNTGKSNCDPNTIYYILGSAFILLLGYCCYYQKQNFPVEPTQENKKRDLAHRQTDSNPYSTSSTNENEAKSPPQASIERYGEASSPNLSWTEQYGEAYCTS